MRFDEFVQYHLSLWQTAQNEGRPPSPATLCLGRPGIGKSAASKAVASLIATFLGRSVVDLTSNPSYDGDINKAVLFYPADLSSMLPEDIGGIPKPAETSVCGEKIMVTTYAVQRWLAPFLHPQAVGVLVFDDIAAANLAVQVAVRQAILDRRVGQHKFGDGVMLIATGNRREDKAGASTLPSHFLNAVCQIPLDPELKSWADWYGSTGLNPVIPAFLMWRPTHFSQSPGDADSKGAFASPRSWAMLGRVWEQAKKANARLEVASGTVGEGVAKELVSFDNLRSEIVDPAEVLKDPKKALPDPERALNTPDKRYAMVTAIAELSAERSRLRDPKARKGTGDAFYRALAWVTVGNREYASSACNHFIACRGISEELVEAARNLKNDPDCKDLLDSIRKSMRGGR